jgi:ABC-type oligopeptide transport system substrate-binding subunit
MRISTVVICAFVIGAMLAIAGCGHKLVAHNGESTVAVYPDENTFTKLSNLKKQGGVVGGMIGGLGEGLAAKQVDNNTPVRIINSDDNGSQVEVLDGAFKGMQGFVPKDNVH